MLGVLELDRSDGDKGKFMSSCGEDLTLVPSGVESISPLELDLLGGHSAWDEPLMVPQVCGSEKRAGNTSLEGIPIESRV